MSQSFPRLEAYVDTLPSAGFSAWSDCEGKASLVRIANRLRPVTTIHAGLPEHLHQYFNCTLPASQWIPELDYILFSLAMADIHGWDHDGIRAFGREVMTDINESAMYGLLFRFLSAKMLVTTVASRWGSFHRGTTCTARKTPGGDLEIVLGFPAGMFNAFIVHGYLGVFESLAEHSRLFKGNAFLSDFNAVQARYRIENIAE